MNNIEIYKLITLFNVYINDSAVPNETVNNFLDYIEGKGYVASTDPLTFSDKVTSLLNSFKIDFPATNNVAKRNHKISECLTFMVSNSNIIDNSDSLPYGIIDDVMKDAVANKTKLTLSNDMAFEIFKTFAPKDIKASKEHPKRDFWRKKVGIPVAIGATAGLATIAATVGLPLIGLPLIQLGSPLVLGLTVGSLSAIGTAGFTPLFLNIKRGLINRHYKKKYTNISKNLKVLNSANDIENLLNSTNLPINNLLSKFQQDTKKIFDTVSNGKKPKKSLVRKNRDRLHAILSFNNSLKTLLDSGTDENINSKLSAISSKIESLIESTSQKDMLAMIDCTRKTNKTSPMQFVDILVANAQNIYSKSGLSAKNHKSKIKEKHLFAHANYAHTYQDILYGGEKFEVPQHIQTDNDFNADDEVDIDFDKDIIKDADNDADIEKSTDVDTDINNNTDKDVIIDANAEISKEPDKEEQNTDINTDKDADKDTDKNSKFQDKNDNVDITKPTHIIVKMIAEKLKTQNKITATYEDKKKYIEKIKIANDPVTDAHLVSAAMDAIKKNPDYYYSQIPDEGLSC